MIDAIRTDVLPYDVAQLVTAVATAGIGARASDLVPHRPRGNVAGPRRTSDGWWCPRVAPRMSGH